MNRHFDAVIEALEKMGDENSVAVANALREIQKGPERRIDHNELGVDDAAIRSKDGSRIQMFRLERLSSASFFVSVSYESGERDVFRIYVYDETVHCRHDSE